LASTRVLTDLIEVFPIEDLGDMSLTDYVVMAFDPVPPPGPDDRARLDALEGSVLLVPERGHAGGAQAGRRSDSDHGPAAG
jgi:hypothetical protein